MLIKPGGNIRWRYYINIDGCSHKVYGVIAEGDDGVYTGILAAHGLFHEHAWPGLREQVEKLKPEWNRTQPCYEWTDETELWGVNEEDGDEAMEGVVCGDAGEL